MKGVQNGNSTGLEGDWALFVPLPGSTSATVNFSGNKFKEVFEMGSGTNSAELTITGDDTSDNHTLHLNNEQFQINKSVSFEAMSFRELYKKSIGADFTMEWNGTSLVYLASGAEGANGGATTTLALSRNGAQPDPKKVGVEVEINSTTTSDGQSTTTTTTNTGGDTGNTAPQPPGTDQSQPNQYSGQGGSVAPSQDGQEQSGQGSKQTPQTPTPPPTQVPTSSQSPPAQDQQAPQQAARSAASTTGQ
jgi:hypothetical protein